MINVEPQWVSQAQKGNAEAFSHLVEAYQRPVFNLCYRMLGDPDEAEDAAQETFLRAYTGIKRYDSQRSFSTWLLSIAAHYCIDQIRRRHMTLVSIDDDPEVDLPDAAPGPESSLNLKENQQKVRALLAELNPQDRAAVILLYWYDLSYDEIAEALSLTVSAVKSRLHRARLELADHWNEKAAANPAQRITAERMKHGKANAHAF